MVFTLTAFTLSPAWAQPFGDEAILAQRVQEAEAAVVSLTSQLERVRTEGAPLIAAQQVRLTERDRLTDRLNAVMDLVDLADDQVRRLPVTLTARRDALTDILVRMYNDNADADRIAARERELADVRRQIAAFEADNAPRLAAVDAARAERDRIQAQRDTLDLEISDQEIPVIEARAAIDSLSRQLADAHDALARIRDLARFELDRNSPPYLLRVEVASRGGGAAYVANWEDAARESEALLRLAQYLHADLTRSIDQRQDRIDEWVEITETDMAAFNAAMDDYTRLIGGSNDGMMWYVERGLDYMTGGWGGALVASGSLTWRKIGVELGDAALTVFRDTRNGVPTHLALGVEAVFQVGSALFGGPKNPSWDVTQNPSLNTTVRSSRGPVTAQQEQNLIQGISSAGVRRALERMRGQLGDDLEAENYRDRLVGTYGNTRLASAASLAVFTAEAQPLDLDSRGLLGRDPLEWAWDFASTPSGQMKTLMKEAMFGEGTLYSDASAVFLDALQSAVRDGLLEQLERERIEAWDRVMRAELDVSLSVASLRNQGRIRRIEQRFRTVLAEHVIPDLTREVESLRNQRRLVVSRDDAVTGRTANLALTFSAPVVIDSVQLEGRELEFEGDATQWTASFRPGDFDRERVTLAVEAHHAAIADRRLDNPSTMALWSTLERRFTHYEMNVDQHHQLLLDPPEGTAFAIVLDTSGSMIEDGSTRLTEAQSALAGLFTSGRIRAGDEVALYTFNGCAANLAVFYTDDVEAAAAAVASTTADGATPLAATIEQASRDLAARNVQHGSLVVVTDGLDSCSGNVAQALRDARDRVDAIRTRIVR